MYSERTKRRKVLVDVSKIIAEARAETYVAECPKTDVLDHYSDTCASASPEIVAESNSPTHIAQRSVDNSSDYACTDDKNADYVDSDSDSVIIPQEKDENIEWLPSPFEFSLESADWVARPLSEDDDDICNDDNENTERE